VAQAVDRVAVQLAGMGRVVSHPLALVWTVADPGVDRAVVRDLGWLDIVDDPTRTRRTVYANNISIVSGWDCVGANGFSVTGCSAVTRGRGGVSRLSARRIFLGSLRSGLYTHGLEPVDRRPKCGHRTSPSLSQLRRESN
jgi:hypothetical protein